jgi:hypothetical protein
MSDSMGRSSSGICQSTTVIGLRKLPTEFLLDWNSSPTLRLYVGILVARPGSLPAIVRANLSRLRQNNHMFVEYILENAVNGDVRDAKLFEEEAAPVSTEAGHGSSQTWLSM